MTNGATIFLLIFLILIVYLAATGKLSKVWTAVKS